MARTKEFDVDQALERAVEVFWDKGFEATSLRDLEHHMGIGRQSLYDTFGDKKQLFLQAMDRYTSRAQDHVKARLLHPDASLPELRSYFADAVKMMTPQGDRPGCLMTSAILEIGESDPDVSTRCKFNEKQMTRAFRDVLQRARDRSEVRADLNAEHVATYLVGQIYALTVLAKNGAPRASLQRMVEHAFETL